MMQGAGAVGVGGTGRMIRPCPMSESHNSGESGYHATLAEIGAVLGVSGSRAEQIITATVRKLWRMGVAMERRNGC